jgi:hypothetical protein
MLDLPLGSVALLYFASLVGNSRQRRLVVLKAVKQIPSGNDRQKSKDNGKNSSGFCGFPPLTQRARQGWGTRLFCLFPGLSKQEIPIFVDWYCNQRYIYSRIAILHFAISKNEGGFGDETWGENPVSARGGGQFARDGPGDQSAGVGEADRG